MTARVRSRSTIAFTGGEAIGKYPYIPDQHQAWNAYTDQWTSDVVGNYGQPNPFESRITNKTIGWVNGWASNVLDHHDWLTLIPASYASANRVPNLYAPAVEDAALMGMARTNINNPEVDIPVFVAELRDLPEMLKHLGDRWNKLTGAVSRSRKVTYSIRELAEDNLVLNFGWAPLLQDLTKMLDFVADVDKRVGYIERLYSERGLRRKQTVWKTDKDAFTYDCYPSTVYNATLRVRLKFKAKAEMWTSTHWKPAFAPPPRTKQEALELARRLCYGVNGIEFASIWNAMPWTWLTDWFYHIGDYYAAHRGSLPVECTEVCVMQRIGLYCDSFEYLYRPAGSRFNARTGPIYEVKRRFVSSPLVAPAIHLPFLSGKQVSILSSLAFTQKFGRVG